jgi:hypothetical protein
MATIKYKGKIIELHPRAELIAEPMVISLREYYHRLSAKEKKTPAEKRHLLTVHTMQLVMGDREERQK